MPTQLIQHPYVSALCTFAISLGVTLWVKRQAKLDTPNHRSSHTIPTPTGGGLGIALVSIAALTVLGAIVSPYYAMAAGAALLAFTSWLDDTRPLSPFVRLLIQAAAAMGAIPYLWLMDVNLLLWPIVIVAMIWLINLYNFMDGTDGLAATQALLFSLGTLLLFPTLSSSDIWLLTLFSAATFSFLVFNWPPAKIFMGDVGSTVIGLLFGYFLVTHCDSPNQVAAGMILLAGFITDASWTLFVRLVKGEKIWHAHKSHYYQKMAQQFKSHHAPLTTYLLLGALVQWPLAWGALHAAGWNWMFYLLTAITVHSVLCIWFKAGRPSAPTQ